MTSEPYKTDVLTVRQINVLITGHLLENRAECTAVLKFQGNIISKMAQKLQLRVWKHSKTFCWQFSKFWSSELFSYSNPQYIGIFLDTHHVDHTFKPNRQWSIIWESQSYNTNTSATGDKRSELDKGKPRLPWTSCPEANPSPLSPFLIIFSPFWDQKNEGWPHIS